jgi:hypothetical protein
MVLLLALKIEHREKVDYQVNPGAEGGKYLEAGRQMPTAVALPQFLCGL